MKNGLEWELICEAHKNDTARMKVHGGWIVRSLTFETGRGTSAKGTSESMVFITDPNNQLKREWYKVRNSIIIQKTTKIHN